MFDELVGEFVQSEYSKCKRYFIELKHLKICVENYQILERENFKINETIIYSAELHHTLNNRFELHLLLENKNEYLCKKFFYFTLSGTDIKLYQYFE